MQTIKRLKTAYLIITTIGLIFFLVAPVISAGIGNFQASANGIQCLQSFFTENSDLNLAGISRLTAFELFAFLFLLCSIGSYVLINLKHTELGTIIWNVITLLVFLVPKDELIVGIGGIYSAFLGDTGYILPFIASFLNLCIAIVIYIILRHTEGKTFRLGGVHPHDYKISKDAAIRVFDIPKTVTIPLGQHIGAPATATVQKGDKVLVGDVIGTATGFVSANIHSSVSGTVTSVDAVPDGANLRKPAVTIAVEGDEWNPAIDRTDTLVKTCNLEPKEIIAKIAAAGIVGLGGATFPTQVKLSVPPGKKAEILIINGVECEPYLTTDYRLMLEHAEELLVGCEILMRALGVEQCYIGIENNKPAAIKHLNEILGSGQYNKGIRVVPLKMRYPQGGEKQLIAAISKREVPSGGLPIDVGAVVQNVGTTYAVYQAVQKNRPLVDRVVTVTGKQLAQPSNLQVRIGTPISALIEACGGLPADTGKVINGGPMMGRAMANIDAPVTKGTSGVLMMNEKESLRTPEMPCIQCAKCVDACPMGLEPFLISKLSRLRLYDRLEPHHVTDCIECGCCAFTCPSHLPLLDYIRLGKAETMKLIRARKAK